MEAAALARRVAGVRRFGWWGRRCCAAGGRRPRCLGRRCSGRVGAARRRGRAVAASAVLVVWRALRSCFHAPCLASRPVPALHPCHPGRRLRRGRWRWWCGTGVRGGSRFPSAVLVARPCRRGSGHRCQAGSIGGIRIRRRGSALRPLRLRRFLHVRCRSHTSGRTMPRVPSSVRGDHAPRSSWWPHRGRIVGAGTGGLATRAVAIPRGRMRRALLGADFLTNHGRTHNKPEYGSSITPSDGT